VFGGRSGGDDHIPYALADTSPLAGEPLADVFVHLLGLPVSRFGLNEVLDLLASAPLAEAAGLDAADFDRLHDWLQAAGARWGLDANHRSQHQAPRDDAFTWQFALDRLLLGHASGSDGDIAGVAPWPELEGSALEALDRLLGLLRVLARYQKALGEALPPAQWRQRLLALLDALLPEPPQAANSQRALERLRKLINEFARDAEQADFHGTVAPDVVRAHFAGVLAEADTRAPLLTGGVSFGRMVPMRLLPFRVICVLGLNDGDFPRRDPAAGLNQLTAELGTARRRHGDRSLREDDRFLFLQLFASAQDVFYLSYLGADPRDGSVREPSVLVSELIDAAADYHLAPASAARELTVRHSLQPFAPAAFGGGDEPRRFSYRQQWHPAAGSLGGQRRALAPWFDQPLPIPDTLPGEAELSLDALRRFLTDPASQFLSQRLGLRLPEDLGDADDVEPLVMAARGSDTLLLQQAVIEATLDGDEAPLYPRLRARALLPSGALGQRQFDTLQAQTRPYAQALAHWQAGTDADSRRYEVEIDGVRLHGRIDGVHPHGLVRLRPGPLNGRAAIRQGLDWLLANAAGDGLALVQFHDAGEEGLGPHVLPPLPAEQARQVLRRLLQLRNEGLRAPLPYAPSTAWAIYTAAEAKREAEGRARWYGSDRTWGESSGAGYPLALRGRDPFATADSYRHLLHNSFVVFTAVREGRVFPGFDDQGATA
jgi:exodeoxyribonuclease V gamma subunit